MGIPVTQLRTWQEAWVHSTASRLQDNIGGFNQPTANVQKIKNGNRNHKKKFNKSTQE